MPRRKLISIIIPVYNESAGLPAFHKALTKVTDRLPYNFEIIFIDDGSRDNWKPAAKSQFSDGPIGVDDGLRRAIEMVVAAVDRQ